MVLLMALLTRPLCTQNALFPLISSLENKSRNSVMLVKMAHRCSHLLSAANAGEELSPDDCPIGSYMQLTDRGGKPDAQCFV